jgi:hypothetical protein
VSMSRRTALLLAFLVVSAAGVAWRPTADG